MVNDALIVFWENLKMFKVRKRERKVSNGPVTGKFGLIKGILKETKTAPGLVVIHCQRELCNLDS